MDQPAYLDQVVDSTGPIILGSDVPYVPTSHDVIPALLEPLQLTSSDILFDLGSGDGRIVIEAALRYGVRAVGIEGDARLVQQARAQAQTQRVDHLLDFRFQNFFQADLSAATAVVVYLLPKVNLRLQPRLLRQLRPGARIVSHRFPFDAWTPDRTTHCQGHPIYLWKIPFSSPQTG